ncbi:helix-turn-helix domain-containing protein [Gordonia sp. HNM0687]|uniref:Helix-turn-helix domain-containing protein n=1 Tax=Gordonia mangrovi TaxID=2665643 RepID=A0A6L7GU02_9ACTN|nr:helix-turn-helix domain-containing protein [Gordonia mangrovi]
MTDGRPVRSSVYRERNSTADRALDILGLFAPGRLNISGSQVAEELSVAKSTAYRYLQSLTAAHYLEEDPAGGYRLGLKVLELSRLARASYGLSQVALPVMRELSRATDETALLTRRSGARAVCLEKEEPFEHRVRLSYERGSALPLNAGASALVVLAWEDADVVSELLTESRLQQYTNATITSESALVERLAEIRSVGYVVGRGELDADAIGVAAPIRDDRERVVAGISVVAVRSRIPEARIPEVVRQVRDAADRISELVALTAQ